MQNAVKKLSKLDWSFTKATTDEWTHDLHPYPAKFIPQIPRKLIEALSKPGETVLDPFCGGGTTAVEATTLGRNAVGTDTNPIAILISRVKTTALDEEQLSSLKRLAGQVLAWSSEEKGRRSLFGESPRAQFEPSIPAIPNFEHWFSKQVARELGVARATIEAVEDLAVRTAAQVALSRIIVRVSNQDSETRYTRRAKELDRGKTFELLASAIHDITKKLDLYRKVRQSVRVSLLDADARQLSDVVGRDTIDLVVTSPPYPNAFDYHLYHRHRLFWLGYDPRKVMKAEIGSHLNYQRTSRNGIDIFADDMRKVFGELNLILRRKAYCCFVIGESIFDGKTYDNAKLLGDISKGAGFSFRADIKRKLPESKRSFAIPARRLAYEHILILQKR